MKSIHSKRSVVLLAALGSAVLSTASVAHADNPYTYVGCYADGSPLDLPIQAGNSLSMTHEMCSSLCTAMGEPYFGVQDSWLCFCGETYGRYGTSMACNEPCGGNSSRICGGILANSVYENKNKPDGLMGCFADSPSRDLPVMVTSNNPSITIEQCRTSCSAMGYAYAGVQDGKACYCGDSYGSQGTSTACTMMCGGNGSEVCGGAWANSVWEAKPFGGTLAGDGLLDNTTLVAGNTVYSTSKRLYLTMQPDGNLVLYFQPFPQWSTPLWASNTVGNPGAWAIFQPDGNLVVYSSDGAVLWAAGTNGKGATFVKVQDDGNLVIYDGSNSPLWATGTENLVPDSAHCTSDFCPAGTWWSSCDAPFDSNGSDEPYGQGVYVWCNGHTETPGATPDMWLNYFAWTNPNPTERCDNDWGTLDCSPQGPNDVECNNCFFY